MKTYKLDRGAKDIFKNVLLRGSLVLFAFIITMTPLLCLQGVISADDGIVPKFLLGWDPTIDTGPIYKEYDGGWGAATTTLPAGMSVSGASHNEEQYVIEIPDSYLGGDGATFYWAIHVEADFNEPNGGSQQHKFPIGWVAWTGTGCYQDLVPSSPASWDESDFEPRHGSTVFGIDMTRDWNGDSCRWTITYSNIPGHTMTAAQLMIAQAPPGPACFIATAAYGTSTAQEIDVLRAFRDEVLLGNSLGSQLVEFYYQTSPPVADFISESDVLRTLVRELVVDPVASLVEVTESLWRD